MKTYKMLLIFCLGLLLTSAISGTANAMTTCFQAKPWGETGLTRVGVWLGNQTFDGQNTLKLRQLMREICGELPFPDLHMERVVLHAYSAGGNGKATLVVDGQSVAGTKSIPARSETSEADDSYPINFQVRLPNSANAAVNPATNPTVNSTGAWQIKLSGKVTVRKIYFLYRLPTLALGEHLISGDAQTYRFAVSQSGQFNTLEIQSGAQDLQIERVSLELNIEGAGVQVIDVADSLMLGELLSGQKKTASLFGISQNLIAIQVIASPLNPGQPGLLKAHLINEL